MRIELQAELEKERKAVAELEACDPEQLESLKAGIAEQKFVDNYRSADRLPCH